MKRSLATDILLAELAQYAWVALALIVLALCCIGCGRETETYDYPDISLSSLKTLYVPGMKAADSPIAQTKWNCGLRAVALLRDGIDVDWDPVALEHYVSDELPLRSMGVSEGMGTAEVEATARRVGFGTRVNISTGFDDIWEGVQTGYPSVLLIQRGLRDDTVTQNKILHWIPVIGIGQDSARRRYLIVVDGSDSEVLPESDFRSLVWWDMGGFSGAAVKGAGIRPGTSIRIDTRALRAQEEQ